ncbi:MAG TPA: chain-length determining protein [Candidatus Anaerostipes avicola]|nr:Wzz/FepE/Etk N-terminal domain-containing protein [uncultured Anaerostipes sp.]HJC83778.1 chain-length determining protein [Candidatus Anaerostipes avicola]
MYELENDEIEIDLGELFRILKSKILIILLTVVIFAGAAGVITKFAITPVYSSSVQLYVASSDGISSLRDLTKETQLTQDYMAIVKTRTVLDKVIDNLNLKMDDQQLGDKVTVENPADTRILKITVTDEDPKEAREIAQEVANITASTVSSKMDTKKPAIIENAYLADAPDSPSLKKNIAIGALIGLVLSAGYITLRFIFDDTIRKEEDIEKYLKINTLAKLPLARGDEKRRKKVRKVKEAI